MTEADLQKRLLDDQHIRIEPEMARYVLRRMEESSAAAGAKIAVMGADARTGVPLRRVLNASSFQSSARR